MNIGRISNNDGARGGGEKFPVATYLCKGLELGKLHCVVGFAFLQHGRNVGPFAHLHTKAGAEVL